LDIKQRIVLAAQHAHTSAPSFAMLKFFIPLSAADAVKQQQQQHAASAAVIAARASAAAAISRRPGRPKKLLNVNSALAAPADSEGVIEQPAKRGKYQNWSVCSHLLTMLGIEHS
jgi:hypothetical protein